LIRVVFDRELRTPPGARIFSTPEAGPVIIVTSPPSYQRVEARGALEAQGAELAVAADSSMRAALQRLGERDISSLLLEGGAALQCAAWQEDVVDFVRLYVTPHVLGAGGVPFLEGCRFSTTTLAERRVVPLGPDVLIEGYVHGPH
jgi:diaminohydroxyphosphoribosylaminopyrimidine deaminase / 5-amino-6-(5-phosphoribosylamino)uracil reductase